jgi:hypothetical protein
MQVTLGESLFFAQLHFLKKPSRMDGGMHLQPPAEAGSRAPATWLQCAYSHST